MALRQDIIKHWHSFKNPLINDILIDLEKIEKDYPPLTEQETNSIEKLLSFFHTANVEKVDELKLIQILNQLPAAYMLYMVHKLQSINTDLVMKVINYAQKHKENDKDIANFFQRNMVFEKSQLLGRIFSNTRMENVLQILLTKKA
ncbi:MAG: hypothetical protein K0R66_581 [Gammaproteobacteria bacterium]|jgi:hypothetical protein|nr:hypothetical protein [Gammaproteobacteria bacterium]